MLLFCPALLLKILSSNLQVPQFILDAEIEAGRGGACSVVCTQPRRIAAVSVAERVANERCEPAPGENGALVGYHVRLDAAR